MTLTQSERSRNWKLAHPESTAAYQRKRYDRLKTDPEFHSKKMAGDALYRLRLKLAVLSHYSPEGKLKCCWPGCIVDDIDCLTLDHLNNDGAEDRKKTRKDGGCNTYTLIRKNGYPPGFQTLCGSHQLKKEILLRRGHEQNT